MLSTVAIRRAIVRGAAIAVCITALIGGPAAPASASTSTDLLYSVDGGATWSPTVTAQPGQTVLVRQWFNNDGIATIADASVETDLPAALTRQPGTRLCLSPQTTSPTSPVATEERCRSIDDGSVWSGRHLSVAPSAGAFGVSNGATTGPLAAGRTRYFSFVQGNFDAPCPARLGSIAGFIPLANEGDPRISTQTQASWTTAPLTYSFNGCVNIPYTGGLQDMTLLGNRYLNIHECQWTYANGRSFSSVIDPDPTWSTNPAWGTGTNTSETADAGAPTCGAGGAGTTFLPSASGTLAVDLLAGRYLRIDQCRWESLSGPRTWITSIVHNAAGDGTMPTNTSAAPAALGCANPDPSRFQFDTLTATTTFDGSARFDLLDVRRGKGFVEYAVTVASTPSPQDCLDHLPPADQVATLDIAAAGAQTSTGTITTDWSALGPNPCPNDPSPAFDPAIGVPAIGILFVAATVAARRPRRFER